MTQSDNSVVNITDDMKAAALPAARKYDAWQKACDEKIATRPSFGASKEDITNAQLAGAAATRAELEWNSTRNSLLNMAHRANPRLTPTRGVDGTGHAEWTRHKAGCEAILQAALNDLLGATAAANGLRAPEGNQFFDTERSTGLQPLP